MKLWAAAKNSFMLVWRCYQFLPGFLANGHFSRVLRQSQQSNNDNDDNKLKSDAL